eukprot:CAMPEP_0194313328 /NCGR_PEP_ID=MMETSP0171-20130528/10212_1 /TAXON_ID=218684 /ORGANISM="Corethron pennatum, Strain L29A3" /LENGTH=218 /DNA_ID=CAMNT_0039068241 /DNA_START=72 /DNA_END=728 /DNA_ORIENTATION=+
MKMVFSKASLAFIVLMRTVTGSKLQVDVYSGPKECDDSGKVKVGDFISIHYTGSIDQSSETGKKGYRFDSSRDRGQVFDTYIGTGNVFKGWDEGIVGLCVGDKATLIMPPEMGYGDEGQGAIIPGGATLHFDIEVVSINEISDAPDPYELFGIIDTNSDRKISKDELIAYMMTGNDEPESVNLQVEASMLEEDTDKDGFISWSEFRGPKGEDTMGDEL